jgi:hypothetical protein
MKDVIFGLCVLVGSFMGAFLICYYVLRALGCVAP